MWSTPYYFTSHIWREKFISNHEKISDIFSLLRFKRRKRLKRFKKKTLLHKKHFVMGKYTERNRWRDKYLLEKNRQPKNFNSFTKKKLISYYFVFKKIKQKVHSPASSHTRQWKRSGRTDFSGWERNEWEVKRRKVLMFV